MPPEEISVGFQNYDPYTQGWYLLPVEAALVPSGAGDLTPDQIAVLNSHTIQGLIELVYVRVGNDVLYGGLSGLDKALQVTTDTLSVLSAVQELHNTLTVSSLGSFSAWFRYQDSYRSESAYMSNYNSVASAFFGVPIVPDFIYSSAGAEVIVNPGDGGTGTIVKSYAQFAEEMAQVRNDLSQQVDELSILAAGTADFDDPNSLYNTSKQVLEDMPPEVAGGGNAIAWTAAKLWALDYYGAFNGQDLAQDRPTHVVITYEHVPDVWLNVSLNRGRQLGMGTGFLGGVEQTGVSLRLTAGMILTFSGRLAIGVSYTKSGPLPTMLMINPLDPQGAVANPLVSVAGADGVTPYIGSFGGATRGQAENAGLFQQNITLAMTAAQGLNNTQNEQVRAFLFVFEEYYKSASSLLSSITQLIQTFGRGIRPS